jgi:hypothetical protein
VAVQQLGLWCAMYKFALHQGELRPFEATCLVPLAEQHQSVRLHIHKPEYDPERINLILVIALLLAVGAAIFC